MICVAIIEHRLEALLQAMAGIPFAEVRMEQLKPTPKDIEKIFSRDTRTIATMRPGTVAEDVRANTLVAAVAAGADYVDVEIEADARFKEKVVGAAKKKGCQVIISFHNFEMTPSTRELEEIIDNCFKDGADLAKVACQANSFRDSARLMGLCDRDEKIVALGMGEAGKITRIASPFLGQPITFASREAGLETAGGQLDVKSLTTIMQLINKTLD
jgi:3-dehydroquinate dehydratase-1